MSLHYREQNNLAGQHPDIVSEIDRIWMDFMQFRYYPKLRREDPDGSSQQAKDCLNQVIEEAARWGMAFYLPTTEFWVPESLYDVSPELFNPLSQNMLWPRLDAGTQIKVPLPTYYNKKEKYFNFTLRLDQQGKCG